MKIHLKHYLVGLCAVALPAMAQTLLPQPQQVEWKKGYFNWQKPYRLECRQSVAEASAPVQQWLPAKAVTAETRRVVILEKGNPAWNDEAYQLYVSADTVKVCAKNEAGFIAARATLAQLTVDGKQTRAVMISDSPAYRYRGAMLDVSRHFYPIEFVKKQVDLLARYKFNRLHLHLTDAAGWRMEIKRYPRLTELAAWRTDSLWKTWWDGERKYVEEGTPGAYGGYYTQRELRDLVDYALERGITIIPEIEMPAHSE
ncbi:MAG: family 20 glycosylhydrolase, partial [Bacteroidaceae bacterium]|nr:family 20 glycosylhydrolase [Bacteroidaceae bacterium]